MGGIFDAIKTAGRSVWNVAKQPIKALWTGIKQTDQNLMNPVVQAGISAIQPEVAPIFGAYDLAKYIGSKLGGNYITTQLDNL